MAAVIKGNIFIPGTMIYYSVEISMSNPIFDLSELNKCHQEVAIARMTDDRKW